jgi:hypothetical protein
MELEQFVAQMKAEEAEEEEWEWVDPAPKPATAAQAEAEDEDEEQEHLLQALILLQVATSTLKGIVTLDSDLNFLSGSAMVDTESLIARIKDLTDQYELVDDPSGMYETIVSSLGNKY